MKSSAVVREDPTSSLPVGAKLHFRVASVPAIETEGLTSVGDWHSFDGTLLVVVFSDGVSDQIVGSAVLVAPGVAIAAAHILDDWIKKAQAGEAGCLLTGFSNSGTVLWKPVHFVIPPQSDLVIISMNLSSELPKDSILTFAHISTRTPRVGEPVMLCGFRGSRNTFQRRSSNVELNAFGYISTGLVQEVFPAMRDRVLVTWPSFQVNCVTVGGMSGGPVFDQSGYLVGIVGRGWNILDGDGEAAGTPSFAWLLWPCLALDFQGIWPSGLHAGPRALLDMDLSLCAIEGREAVERDVVDDQGRKCVKYKQWSERPAT